MQTTLFKQWKYVKTANFYGLFLPSSSVAAHIRPEKRKGFSAGPHVSEKQLSESQVFRNPEISVSLCTAAGEVNTNVTLPSDARVVA